MELAWFTVAQDLPFQLRPVIEETQEGYYSNIQEYVFQ